MGSGIQCRYLSHLSISRATTPALSGPEYGYQSGEVRPQAFQLGSVFQDADRHHSREDLSDGLLDCQISEIGGQVHSPLSSICEDAAVAA